MRKTKKWGERMTGNFSMSVSGERFSESMITTVWSKGLVIAGYDPADYRKDRCGARMKRSSYGTMGQFGWEIDHLKPVAKGGTDDLENLQPLHWQNNRGKADDYPKWTCTVSDN